MTDIKKELSILVRTLNDKRVVSEGEMKQVLASIINILAENKKSVEFLNQDSKNRLESALKYINTEHKTTLDAIQGDLKRSKADIELSTKKQNERAFERLQSLINNIRMPIDGKEGKEGPIGPAGKDGKDGSPDTAEQIRNKLEILKGENRLDASAIRNLPEFVKEKGREMLVGGIRFLENLADVSFPVSARRDDALIQYKTTNNRWENGVALTVSTTAPSDPQENDLWVDIS